METKFEGALSWEVLSSSWAACGWWEISSWRLLVLSTAWCQHCQCYCKPIGINARKTEMIKKSLFSPLMTWTLRWWSIILHKISDLYFHTTAVCLSELVICQTAGWAKGRGKKAELRLAIWEALWFPLVFPLRLFTELYSSSAKGRIAEFPTSNLYVHHFLMYLHAHN